MPSPTQKIGFSAEAIVDAYLIAQGWRILEKNYRLRMGELDRIALAKDGVLVFVEIKSRVDVSSLGLYPLISTRQMQRLSRMAHYFLWKKGTAWEEDLGIEDYRFDAILVNQDKIYRHFKNLLLPRSMRGF